MTSSRAHFYSFFYFILRTTITLFIFQLIIANLHTNGPTRWNYAILYSLALTFRGLMETLSWSMFIPGIMTLIFRGPLNPKTLVSCRTEHKHMNQSSCLYTCDSHIYLLKRNSQKSFIYTSISFPVFPLSVVLLCKKTASRGQAWLIVARGFKMYCPQGWVLALCWPLTEIMLTNSRSRLQQAPVVDSLLLGWRWSLLGSHRCHIP